MGRRSKSASVSPTIVDDPSNVLPGKQRIRLTAILEKLRQSGTVTVEVLSALNWRFSGDHTKRPGSAQRDGLLQRTHGGAVSIEPLFYEPFKERPRFPGESRKVCRRKAPDWARSGGADKKAETIALTPGTTTLEIIRCLPLNQDITVVTNTVNIAMELSKRKDIDVFVTGGHLRGDWFSLVGTDSDPESAADVNSYPLCGRGRDRQVSGARVALAPMEPI